MTSLPETLLQKYHRPLGLFLILAIFIGGGVLALTEDRSKPTEISISEPPGATVSGTVATAPEIIKVDLSGAVASPGVYELPKDARVQDALTAAGGLAKEADNEWLARNLNLAAKLSDGDKIYIPEAGETTSVPYEPPTGVVSGAAGSAVPSETTKCGKVNINTASAATLDECLAGIGPAYAERIIEYRQSHGGFKTIEEIQEVSGIGPATFAKIKDRIAVE